MSLASTAPEVTVALRAQRAQHAPFVTERRALTRALVEAAAATAAPGGEDRVSVVVAGRLVAAREVVVAALGCAPADIALGHAAQALTDLGFEVAGRAPRPPCRVARQAPPAPGREGDDAPAEHRYEGEDAPPAQILSADVARRLRRHVGRWVALRDGDVVAVGDSLRDVIAASAPTDADPVTVLYVPRPGADGSG